MTWVSGRIGDFADIKHGFAFKGEDFGSEGEFIVITPGNCFERGGFRSRGDREKFYSGQVPEGYLLSKGDTLVVMTDLVTTAPVLGGSFRIPEDHRYLHNQRLGLVQVTRPDLIDDRFLYHLFNTHHYRTQVRGSASGATVRHTSPGRIKSCKVNYPQSLREQARIAEVVDRYDDLIDNNRKRITLLEESARLLYREWFTKLRFPGHEHLKVTDGLPEGWTLQTLGDIAETNPFSYQAKGLPDEVNYVDISSVARGRIISKAAMPAAAAPGRARRRALDGDIIWSNVRPNLRSYALVLEPEDNDVFSTGFTVLSARTVPFTWLYQFVTTDAFVGHLVNHATGAGYPAVRPDDFERAKVAVPPASLLNAFHESTEPTFRLISKLEQQNRRLAEARDLLLPRLMNREIAV